MGLKDIRNRIDSVKSTKQITSAMKMVSAAYFKKAQDAIVRMRPYANKLHEILTHLSESLDAADNVYSQQRDSEKILLVLVASNRGLCGAFNSNVVKKAIEVIDEQYSEQYKKGNVELMLIGKKMFDILKRKPYKIASQHHEIYNDLSFSNVASLPKEIMAQFKAGKYDRVDIVYNSFKNAASQILTHEQFLPVKIEKDENASVSHDFIFEPSKKYIVEQLIPKSLKVQFYKALLDSNAAEHGARMTAMHKATDNATDLIRDLTLKYNKARQASITKEILEIVGGAEALK